MLLLFCSIILFIRSSWGQDIIVYRATKYLSEKIGTAVSIDHLYITFTGNVFLENLFMEDRQGDTLIYSKNLEMAMAFMPLIKTKTIDIQSVTWNGVKANIHEDKSTGQFNYSYIQEAFAGTDTTSTANGALPTIKPFSIYFEDFLISYKDKNTSSKLRLGILDLKVGELDLDSLQFEVENLILSSSKLDLVEYNSATSSEGTNSTTSLPTIVIKSAKITETDFNFESFDQTRINVGIGTFETKAISVDMGEKDVQSESILIENTHLSFKQRKDSSYIVVADPSTEIWPDWGIAVAQIQLENNKIEVDRSKNDPVPGVFDFDKLGIDQLSLQASDFLLKKKTLIVQLSNLEMQDQSGVKLKKLALNLKASDQDISISNLHFVVNNTAIKGTLQSKFTSLDGFLQNPLSNSLKVDLPSFKIDLHDAFYFNAELAQNPYIDTLSQKLIMGKIGLEGTIDRLNISMFELQWGSRTALDWVGTISNLTNPQKLFAKITSSTLRTQKVDLEKWVSMPNSMNIPGSILMKSKIRGGLHSLTGDVQLSTSLGKIFLKGSFSDLDSIAFNLQLAIDDMKLDQLLLNENLGSITTEIVASGSGSDLQDLNARFTSDFTDVTLSNQKIAGMKLIGNMTKGSGTAELNIKDPNIELALKANMVFDSIANKISSSLDVVGIDFYKLGLSNSDLRAKFNLGVDFEGTLSEFDVKAKLRDGLVVVDNHAIPISNFDLQSSLSPDTSNLQFQSLPITINLQGNSSPQELFQTFESKIFSYITDSISTSSDSSTVRMKMELTLRESPFLTETLFKGLEHLDSTTVKIDFDSKMELFSADVHLPSVSYKGAILDSLYMQMNGDKEAFYLNAGWSHLKSGMLEIQQTALVSRIANKVISSDFSILEGKEKWIQVRSEISQINDTLFLHILPKGLILAKQLWSVLPENEMQIASKYIGFRDFEFSMRDQKITYTNSQVGREAEHLAVLFENFRLGDITGFLNPEKVIADGTMQGDLVVEYPFGHTGIVADLGIPDFKILETPLGNLQLSANVQQNHTYEMNLSIKGENADIQLSGNYLANPSGADLHLDYTMDHLNVAIFEGIFSNNLSSASGSLRARAKLSGRTTHPEYNGTIGFKEVGFKVNSLNTSFKLANEEIRIDNAGVHLDQFKISDAAKNDFILTGKVSTDEISNPAFDLFLKAKNFEVINSTKEDNDLFFGNLLLDLDLTVKGDLNLPKVRGSMKINQGSNLTYIIPQSELDLVERNDVVLFVNRKDSNNIITSTRQNENSSTTTTGYDVKTKLTIDKKSSFSVVIDPKFNDNLVVSGTGVFDFGLEPNGRTTLFGRYEIKSGGYETNLYNFIKRKFNISPGGSIVWNGDMYSAKMDLRAVYNVTTSPSALMNARIAGASSSVTNQYQQPIPFLVYINVNGVLVNPEISFNLDIPEDKQGVFGGGVYQTIQQLNAQPDQLNKQVFSLLVLNQFFPSSGSNGSKGGATSIARDNVNQVLSDQLNRYSDKLLGKAGVQVGFDLNSYTESQAASSQSTNTQLDITASKQLLNDRLIVQVGSEVGVTGANPNSSQGNSIIGNVSLEYMLTKDQRLRLLGFSKNEYDNLIDGQLTVSGISLVFIKEFNRLRELWEKDMADPNERELQKK